MEKVISNEANQIKAGLLAGGITAILASVCCLGPLVLVLLGVGGAWASTLTWFYPLKPYLIGGTYLLLAWTGFQLYRPKKSCAIGSLCANPKYQKLLRIIFWSVLGLVSALFLLPEVLPYFLLD
ncbi:MAG: hypothetical protein KAJ32_02115 [Gammaproteobacteria bacterium]|nr:hypothetical protein [Gammaproteobacteria bacterium]